MGSDCAPISSPMDRVLALSSSRVCQGLMEIGGGFRGQLMGRGMGRAPHAGVPEIVARPIPLPLPTNFLRLAPLE
jgi:hypothetical protein